MLSVDLDSYDILIATPPCNYYRRANYRRNNSYYSLATKHLLPEIIKKFEKTKKPFIVENVINKKLMIDIINNFNYFYYEKGRHCYFTNVKLDLNNIPQETEIIQNMSRKKRQGGKNVQIVLEYFIEQVLINKILKEETKC